MAFADMRGKFVYKGPVLASAMEQMAENDWGMHAEGQFMDNSIDAVKLKDRSITQVKLGLNSVANENLQLLSVATGNLQDGAVTTEKLQDAAVTDSKLKFTEGSWGVNISLTESAYVDLPTLFAHLPEFFAPDGAIRIWYDVFAPTPYDPPAVRLGAYNPSTSEYRRWQGRYFYHSASDQLIEIVFKDEDVIGWHLRELTKQEPLRTMRLGKMEAEEFKERPLERKYIFVKEAAEILNKDIQQISRLTEEEIRILLTKK